jgi:hypothetical protein
MNLKNKFSLEGEGFKPNFFDKSFKVISRSIFARRISKFFLLFSIALFVCIWNGQLEPLTIIQGYLLQPATAQTQVLLNPEAVASKVYAQIGELPKENQYINKERQQADPNNTLVSRIVRYHQYVKNRPTDFRLDWQLTLADYFGLNEDIKEINYPGGSTLTINPLESDRQIISKLNRQQRNQLVDLLVSIYNPNSASTTTPNPTTQTPTQSAPVNTKPALPLPKPGDADLLK